MNKDSFSELKKRLKEVNSIIKNLDPAIRLTVFDMMRPYVQGSLPEPLPEEKKKREAPPHDKDTKKALKEYYTKFQPNKPADVAKILAGWIYKTRGSEPFTFKEIGDLSDVLEVTRPARLEMTFKASRHKGKKLFVPAGHGKVKPTVHGANYFKQLFKGQIGKKDQE
jgi:hypothetical protein